jgi:primosomal protein N' (replication factor Y)
VPQLILHVAIPVPLFKVFDYLPPLIENVALCPGLRVLVPLGKRQLVGLLIEISGSTEIDLQTLRPVRAIIDSEPIFSPDLLALLQWARHYYHHPPGEVFFTALPILLRRGVPATLSTNSATSVFKHVMRSKEQWVDSLDTCKYDLNAAQAAAVAMVLAALERFQVFLMEGVSGSGKTEVYLSLIEAVIARNRQVLVLVPEICLTPRLLELFQMRLSAPPAVLHSGLSDRERLDAWLLTRSGITSVLVGTRSAVFTPFKNLGLLIIDEEHDTSFKQGQGFRYHARDLAVIRGKQLGIPVILSSATPTFRSFQNAQSGRYQLLHLSNSIACSCKPFIEIIDMRCQSTTEGLSQKLLERIKLTLNSNEQVLLFLNRRGFATALLCHECGWSSQCRNCDSHMTLHLDQYLLICHHCGDTRTVDTSCPVCLSTGLQAIGCGTERLEKLLHEMFPKIDVTRIDRDSTRRRDKIEVLISDINVDSPRLLIGTQMLAKGHHFPKVTLVGIIDIDYGLYSSIDFLASERTAQLILQVVGRTGHEGNHVTVIIQTYQPDNPLLQILIKKGYLAFSSIVLAERQSALLPPFAYQALLRAEADSVELAISFLQSGVALATDIRDGVELLGPAPAPRERRAGRYREQLLLQAKNRQNLHRFLDLWIPQLKKRSYNHRVNWSIDIDPIEIC